MRTKNHRMAVAGLVATVALLGAACGGDEDDATASAPAEQEMEEEAGTDTDATTDDDSTATTEAEGDEMAMGPTGPACGAVPADGEGSFAGMADDPAATAASNNPALSTLVAAVQQADLVDTLNTGGPFTIFAPVNDAFAQIPQADLDALLADQQALTQVLTAHVVPEQLSASELMDMESVETVNGAMLSLSSQGDSLTVGGDASVVCANIETANATVHLIDGVLMPMQ